MWVVFCYLALIWRAALALVRAVYPKRAVFGNSSNTGQDAGEGSGFKAVCSSRLGRFAASCIPCWPNVSGYILNVAAGSWRVCSLPKGPRTPRVISILCWLDRHVSGLRISFCVGKVISQHSGRCFIFLDWVFFGRSCRPVQRDEKTPSFSAWM